MRRILIAATVAGALISAPGVAKAGESEAAAIIGAVAVTGGAESLLAGAAHFAGYGKVAEVYCNRLGNEWHGPNQRGDRYATMGECVGWRTTLINFIIGQPRIQPVEE